METIIYLHNFTLIFTKELVISGYQAITLMPVQCVDYVTFATVDSHASKELSEELLIICD